MLTFAAAVYIFVSIVFAIAGYTTTARYRLHLGLCLAASLVWPISLLVVVGAVLSERLGRLRMSAHAGRGAVVGRAAVQDALGPAENASQGR
jgi:hypothetical protein